ncbi:MAG TPA: sodium:proton antiporter [Phycisphaerales bacterium]|nr:sodium:proton antiporter [Phycisphaerales bacterium]
MVLAAISEGAPIPAIGWVAPFVALLLAIALLPLIPRAAHWWHSNRNKLIVGGILGAVTLVHFLVRDHGVVLHGDHLPRFFRWMGMALTEDHGHFTTPAGFAGMLGAVGNSVMEYIPFLTLLLTLYCISGGIAVRGGLRGTPTTNTAIMALGGLIASFVGTTGAAMLLIRPLLNANRERQRVAHTVVFFIFIVCNVGGCLLPIGDPPLFIGYLKGVPFFWTLVLAPEWAFMLVALLVIYFLLDRRLHRNDALRLRALEETQAREPIRILGAINFLWLALAVVAVATINPSRPLPGTDWVPPIFARELVQLALVGLSFRTTPKGVREENGFNFEPIGEVAALFIGIFVTMQVPLEILSAKGASLGLAEPWQFFWTTGVLSAFLDNAPTYAVFFQVAESIGPAGAGSGDGMVRLADGGEVRSDLLIGVSLGAVFMGAMSYIGNGPNFMVKAIAERAGVAMPSFFGYMGYSAVVMLPPLVVVTILFMR